MNKITGISVFIRAKQINGTSGQITSMLNGQEYLQYLYQKSTIWITPTNSYITYQWEYPLQPNGSTWNIDSINNMTVGVKGSWSGNAPAGNEIRVTQIYVKIYFKTLILYTIF